MWRVLNNETTQSHILSNESFRGVSANGKLAGIRVFLEIIIP